MANSMEARSSRWFASLVDYPVASWALVFGLTCLAIGGYLYPTWPQELYRNWIEGATIAANDGSAAPVPTVPGRLPRSAGVVRAPLGRADAFLVVESPQFFTRDGAAAIRHVVESLEELDTVASIFWLDQAPPLNIFGLAEPVLPKGQATEQRFAHARERAIKHPLIVGQLLSPDAKTMLLLVSYDWIHIREDEDCTTRLVGAAEKAARAFPQVDMKFSITGQIPIRLMLIRNQSENQLKYQLIGYGMILFMSIILFRGLSVVLVVASAPVIGVFWTLGFLRYFELQNNPFSDVILPVLLSLVGFTDGVHMMVHIRRGLLDGHAPIEACRHTLGAVGMACFLTSLTTAIGMGSLVWADHRLVREFGWACVMGVTATWISVMLVIPLVCRTRWSHRLAKGAERNLIDGQLHRITGIVRYSLQYSRWVSYGSIALLLLLAGVALTLRPDDRKSSSMPTGSSAQQTLAHLDRTMGGLDVCQIGIVWHDPETLDTQIAKVISEVDAILESEPLIGHPLSLCKLLAALPGDETPLEKMSMAELLPPPLKLNYYSPDYQSATTTFRVQDLGTMAYEPVFERLESQLESLRKKYDGFQFDMQGDPIWRWRNLYQIVTDLTQSLGSAAVVIFVVMGLVYRSVRIGLISVIPNIMPLLASATWMALTHQPLEIVSVCAFTVCLGIAVDDTIHFLSRYQQEQATETDHHQVIMRSFDAVGTGMIMTTIVLVGGFCSVLFSETRDHRIFAGLGIVTLIVALLCDLFLLPALLKYFDQTRIRR